MSTFKILPVVLLGVASIGFSAGAFATMQNQNQNQNPVSGTLDAAGNAVNETATVTTDAAGAVVDGTETVVTDTLTDSGKTAPKR